MSKCILCPRECRANRKSENGVCGAGDTIKIARAAIHKWEEPCISGTNGSGTVFFSGCALGCEFCQNREISLDKKGIEITPERLYEIFFELKQKSVNNINLVTADHYIPQILSVIKKAKADGLRLPVILNTSSYLKTNTVRALEGSIDIYIADFKFFNGAISKKYCNAPDYPEVAKAAIYEMYKQIGKPVFKNGILKNGVIIRVLVLPSNIIDAKMIIKYIAKTYTDNVIISIMNQYTPVSDSVHVELCRPLRDAEYKSVVDFALKHGVKNAYIQESGTSTDSYVPEFDFEGVL